jgi:hypothetical protein
LRLKLALSWACLKHPIASSHCWLVLVLVIVFCLQWNWILSISKHISFKEYSIKYGQASDVPHYRFTYWINLDFQQALSASLIAVVKLVTNHNQRAAIEQNW